ncbi:MAG: protein kinase [Planctomycetes bacterium]|nr:protein kinase [Planctomycetota bacterium]
MPNNLSAIDHALDLFIGQVELGTEPNLDEIAASLSPSDEVEFLQLVQSYLSLKQSPDPELIGFNSSSGLPIGPYQILQELGRGGSSVVYEAESPDGEIVALKVLPHELATNPSFINRFQHEYRALQQLRHDHIVRVLDFGIADGRPYLCMERLSEATLEHQIQEQSMATPDWSSATIERILNHFTQIVAAVDVLHQKGFVHRDIKPSNILFRSNGDACLGDFGLAHQKAATVLTTEGKALGTLAFMAPERLMSAGSAAAKSPAVDVYSLGVCLFQALTKELPFNGRYPEILALIQQGPPPISLFCPHPIDVRLQAIIEKCLEPAASQRYADAGELLLDLFALQADQPVAARRHYWWRRTRRKMRSYPRVTTAIAALLILVIVLQSRAVYSSYHRLQQINEHLETAATSKANAELEVQRLPTLLNTNSDSTDFTVDQGNWSRLETSRKAFEQNIEQAENALLQAKALESTPGQAQREIHDLYQLLSRWHQEKGDPIQAIAVWQELTNLFPQVPIPSTALSISDVPSNVNLEIKYYDSTTEIQPWPLTSIWKSSAASEARIEDLRPGSYRLEVRRLGSKITTYYPFVAFPGQQQILSLSSLPAEADLDPAWTFIPPGEFPYGGDPEFHASRAEAIADLPGYFITIDEITFELYDQFLLDILEHKCPGDYHQLLGWTPSDHLPPDRIKAFFLNMDARSLGTLSRDEALQVLTASEHSNATYSFRRWSAAHSISFKDAEHFVVWLNQKAENENSPWVYNLPSERQWEKAARGADKRIYPWGNRFDWELPTTLKNVHITGSDEAMGNAMGIGRSPADVSPYGCRDMAGNVREFTTGILLDYSPLRVICGGEESFYLDAFFRMDSRTLTMEIDTNWDFGFRLVRTKRADI